MEKKYIVALDQGTTSSRAVIFDHNLNIIGMKSIPIKQIYPSPGWVEHDPLEIYETQIKSLQDLFIEKNIRPQEISCIGIANQRETTVVWNRSTGIPVHNAIVWQCRRTSDICRDLINKGLKNTIKEKTGLLIDAYFSGTKIKWILDNVKYKDKDELLAGTIDTWLIWKLTKGSTHVTDQSNASRTMLYNISKFEWDKEILNELDIPINMLPKIVLSSGFICNTSKEVFGVSIPICGVAGDQQAALFGQTCFEKGSTKNTYGTGCFILMNTGKDLVRSNNDLISTIAWDIGKGPVYALEGSIFNAGSVIQWLRDEMGLLDRASQSDEIAKSITDTAGVYLVPAFTGLGAPYWDMYARGIITGITRGTNRKHIIRAALESIAYQSKDLILAMEADSRIQLKELRVDGGASKSDFLMQFQADLLGIDILRPDVIEATALGASCLAGLGLGIWKSTDEICGVRSNNTVYSPKNDPIEMDKKYTGWKKAVKKALHIETE